VSSSAARIQRVTRMVPTTSYPVSIGEFPPLLIVAILVQLPPCGGRGNIAWTLEPKGDICLSSGTCVSCVHVAKTPRPSGRHLLSRCYRPISLMTFCPECVSGSSFVVQDWYSQVRSAAQLPESTVPMNAESSQPPGRCNGGHEAPSIRCHNRRCGKRPFAASAGVTEARK
jgi:hypothetical protein